MKLLVTGASGLVGSACVEYFSGKGWEVVGVDNKQRARMFGVEQPIDSMRIDIRDLTELEPLFQEHQFDAIIHAAAQPSHDYATEHIWEDFSINAIGTFNLLDLAHSYCPNAVFVYVSSDKVYGQNIGLPNKLWDETVPLDTAGIRSFFGCSKLTADLYVQEFGNRFDMKTVCFRPGCITGKNHAGAQQHGFLAYLAKCIREEKPYTIFGFEGTQVRDQIHALDLAAAFSAFIENPKIGAVYNIGGGPERALTLLEFGAKLSEKLHKPFTYTFGEAREGDRGWDIHDVTKFRTDYPAWDYTFSLEDIINDICSAK